MIQNQPYSAFHPLDLPDFKGRFKSRDLHRLENVNPLSSQKDCNCPLILNASPVGEVTVISLAL